jgi:hypothetical protein
MTVLVFRWMSRPNKLLHSALQLFRGCRGSHSVGVVKGGRWKQLVPGPPHTASILSLSFYYSFPVYYPPGNGIVVAPAPVPAQTRTLPAYKDPFAPPSSPSSRNPHNSLYTSHD